MGRRTAVILLLMALVAAVAAAGDPSPDVLLLILPGAEVDSGLQQVVTDTVLVQLSRRKLDAQLIDPATTRVSSLSAALELAREDGAQILVYGTCASSGSDLSLRLQAYDPDSRRRFQAATERGPIDITIDSLVSRAINEALAGVTFLPRPLAVVESAEGPPGSPTAAEAGSPPAGDPLDPPQAALAQPVPPAPASANVPSQGQEPVPGPALTKAPPVSTRKPAVTPGSPWYDARTSEFGLYAGFAPFIVTGPLAAYARTGWTALVAADFAFDALSGSLGAGILTGACGLGASGLASSAQVLAVPVGLDLRFTLQRAEAPWLAIHVSAGPAVLLLTTPWSGDAMKAVLYLLGGLVMDLPFSPSLGLTLETNYMVFFESLSLPIMGFAPEASFYVRL